MAEFIEDFAKALAEGGEESIIENETKEIFQTNLEFTNEEFSEIFKEGQSLEKKGGRWTLNKVSPEEFTSYLRSGKLSELMEKMGVEGGDLLNILEKQKTFRTIIRDSPELHLTELDEKFEKITKNIKELNQNIEELTEMNESLQKKVVENAEKSKWIKTSIPLSIITTAALVALVEEVIVTMNKMKGCYFCRMVNGKLEKYKIINRSTNKEIPPNTRDYESFSKSSPHLNKCSNLTLMILQRFRLNKNKIEKEESMQKLMKIFDDNPNPSRDVIKKYINEKTKNLQDHFKAYPIIVSAPLDLISEEERKNLNCIACDPSAPIDSINYTSREGLATNETLKCVDRVTIYEAFKNFGEEVLNDVVDEFSNLVSSSNLLTTITKYSLLIIVLYIIGYFAITYFTKTEHYKRLEEEESEIYMKPLKAA